MSAVKYDPACFKKLLAEAGYPNGFNRGQEPHVVVKHMVAAAIGDLKKVDIRAKPNTPLLWHSASTAATVSCRA